MIMMGCVGSVSMGLFIYVVHPTFWLGCLLRLGQLVFIHTRLVCLTSKIQVPPSAFGLSCAGFLVWRRPGQAGGTLSPCEYGEVSQACEADSHCPTMG